MRAHGVLVAAALLAACSDTSLGSALADGSDGAREPAPSANGGDAKGGASAGAGASGAPPEKEVEKQYEAPVATGNIIWITNPTSGRVALVDAVTLQVRTVEAGNAPTHLASVPGQSVDTTLVLNFASADATLLRATPQGITATTFKTTKDANEVAFSADGRFAIAWANAQKTPNAPKANGFQDLAVLDLQNNTSTLLAVGYRPVTVGFAQGSPRAYAVTQDGVALVDLSDPRAPHVFKNVPISDDPSEDPGTRDVFVTKDGARAFVRRDGSNVITVVAFDSGTRSAITLSGDVTDLDVTDTGDRAVAVVRDKSEVVVLPVADPAQNTSLFVTGETIGSVALAPGGSKALLYTNATAVERLSIVDFTRNNAVRTVRLYSPVLGVFSSPDAQHAIVIHDATSGIDGTPGAFSVVPIGQNLPAKIVGTQAPLVAVAVENDRAILAERGGSVWGAQLARMPELAVVRYALASPPIAVGIIAGARRAYVAQDHPEGRLTFIDLDTGVARTLTGFELSSRVVDGSKP